MKIRIVPTVELIATNNVLMILVTIKLLEGDVILNTIELKNRGDILHGM